MENQRERIREIFLDATEIAAGEERSSFLDKACAGNPELRARVDHMLEMKTEASAFFEHRVATQAAMPRDQAEALEGPGSMIGRYKVLEKIGEGGFGVVYMAEQQEPLKRRVALKVIKLGMDTREVIARFNAERQALALMDHPNVARVLDAGATGSGRPFFVMELVRGLPITDFCDRECLSPRERIDLFIQVCQAVQHAHSKGIIHRDIKPSNILVTVQDGRPIPKIIDFGIAKAIQQPLTAETLFTRFGQMIGTPVYMSPEQTELSAVDVDTRSDVYSLGVVFYELLTGKQPFDLQRLLQVGQFEMVRIIREEEPLRPSTRLTRLGKELDTVAERRHMNSRRLGEMVKGDLDWITMKALQKDRSRRYETAAALAEDLVRYLEHRPVRAGPPSLSYRSLKFVQRHRYAVATAVWILVALLIGLVIAVYGFLTARSERQTALAAERTAEQQRQYALLEAKRAQAKELRARQVSYASDMALAGHALEVGNLGRALSLLSRYENPGTADDLRGWEWRYLWQQCRSAELFQLTAFSNSVLSSAVSADARLAVFGDLSGKIGLWSLPSRTLLWASNASSIVALSPDGKVLAEGTRMIRDAESGIIVRQLPGKAEIKKLAFSGNGRFLAGLVGTDELCVWEAPSWNLLASYRGFAVAGLHFGGLAFSSSGDSLVVGTEDGTIHLVETRTGMIRLSWKGHAESISCLAVSPDSRLIASVSGYSDPQVRLWNSEDGSPAGALSGHRAWIPTVSFSADGTLLASASADQSICVWDLARKELLTRLRGHSHEVWGVAFLADSKTVLTAGKDGTVKVWAIPQEKRGGAERHFQPGELAPMEALSAGISFSPDGRELLGVEVSGWVGRWALPSLRWLGRVEALGSNNCLLASASNLGLLAAMGREGRLRVWDYQKQLLTADIKATTAPVTWLEFAPSARRLVVITEARKLDLWDTSSWQKILSWESAQNDLSQATVSGDGLYLACCGKELSVYALTNGNLLFRRAVHKPFTDAVAFSPDCKLLATGSQEGLAKVWSTSTWKEIATLRGHLLGVHSVAFSSDSLRLATGSLGSEAVKLWDLSTMQEVLNLSGPGDLSWRLGFSPGDRVLVGLGTATGVRCWSAPGLDENAASLETPE